MCLQLILVCNASWRKMRSIHWKPPTREVERNWIVYTARQNSYGDNFNCYSRIKTDAELMKKKVINSPEQLFVQPRKRFVVETRLNTNSLAKWLLLHMYCRAITSSTPCNIRQSEECTIAYLSAPEIEIKSNSLKKLNRKIRSYKNQCLNGCNNLLTANWREFSFCSLQIDYSSSKRGAQLNRLFTLEGVERILGARRSQNSWYGISILVIFHWPSY